MEVARRRSGVAEGGEFFQWDGGGEGWWEIRTENRRRLGGGGGRGLRRIEAEQGGGDWCEVVPVEAEREAEREEVELEAEEELELAIRRSALSGEADSGRAVKTRGRLGRGKGEGVSDALLYEILCERELGALGRLREEESGGPRRSPGDFRARRIPHAASRFLVRCRPTEHPQVLSQIKRKPSLFLKGF